MSHPDTGAVTLSVNPVPLNLTNPLFLKHFHLAFYLHTFWNSP
jgi:hypothetical protein